LKYDYYCDVLRGVNQILSRGALLIAVLLILPLWASNIAQNNSSSEDLKVININELENNGVREEIQRYFGYEDLLFGYLTLPYDVNQNINQVGRHVDNGFIYLALIPLFLLVLLYKRKGWFYLTMLMSILYLCICFSFSRLGKADGRFISVSDVDWQTFLDNEYKGIGGAFLAHAYDLGSSIATPIIAVTRTVTGTQDHISYPLLFTVFMAFLWLISSPSIISKNYSRTLGIISVSFFMLWWLLSSGIIWYGFLMYPLLLTIIVRGIKRSKIRLSDQVGPFFKTLVMGVLTIWICMAFVSRVSNINPVNIIPETSGDEIASKMLMLYSVGLITADECREFSDKNVATGIRALNSDNRLVLRVGTYLEFEIRDNHLRVMEDNTLGLLFGYYKQHRDKEEFIEYLKSLGYGYIILDLNTPFLDRTPEQSLKQKYQIILSHLWQNPKVRLVATNREISTIGSNGRKKTVFKVVAVGSEEYLSYGSYAVYEIL
jgi:hypothetical protein